MNIMNAILNQLIVIKSNILFSEDYLILINIKSLNTKY